MEINIMDYEKMVYKLIQTKLSGYLVKFDIEELYSFGIEGLIKAKNNYKNDSKASFLTYAFKFVELHMRNCITRDRRHYYRVGKNEYLPTDITSILAPVKDIDGVKEVGDLIVSGKDVENDYIEREKITILANAIDKLPETEKYVLVAHYFEEFSQREIAKMLGISNQYASMLAKQARDKLKIELKEIS